MVSAAAVQFSEVFARSVWIDKGGYVYDDEEADRYCEQD